MHRNSLLLNFCSLLAIMTLSACANYALTLNEQVLYMPPSLFSDYSIADTNLRNCVAQTISDQQVVEPTQLRVLNCSNAGIASLKGLTRFYALEELNLASNALKEVPELAKLGKLRLLILRDNPLVDGTPLLNLLNLQELDVSEAPTLPCGDLLQLAGQMAASAVTLPEHCR